MADAKRQLCFVSPKRAIFEEAPESENEAGQAYSDQDDVGPTRAIVQATCDEVFCTTLRLTERGPLRFVRDNNMIARRWPQDTVVCLSIRSTTMRLTDYSFPMAESTRSAFSKTMTFWPTFIFVFVLDFATKRWAEVNLLPLYTPHPLVGETVRLTLAFNKDAAMGLSLGGYSRIGFTVIAAAVLVVLGVFYRRTQSHESAHAFGLALVAAGALGNLADRVLFLHGVVDFIDVGIGTSRFYTFNVADAAITCGAILLAILSMKGPRDAEVTAVSAHTTP